MYYGVGKGKNDLIGDRGLLPRAGEPNRGNGGLYRDLQMPECVAAVPYR